MTNVTKLHSTTLQAVLTPQPGRDWPTPRVFTISEDIHDEQLVSLLMEVTQLIRNRVPFEVMYDGGSL